MKSILGFLTFLLISTITLRADDREDLRKAMAKGNIEAIRSVIASLSKVTLNDLLPEAYPGEERKTPLEYAITASLTQTADRYPQEDVCRLLLEYGADPNKADRSGKSPLMLALSGTATDETIKVLVEHGARLDATDLSGATVSQYAERAHRSELLVSLGAAETNEQKAEREKSIRVTSDVKILSAMFASIIGRQMPKNETELQREERKKREKLEEKKIAQEIAGRKVELQSFVVSDVRAQTILSEAGKKKMAALIQQLKTTGQYEALGGGTMESNPLLAYAVAGTIAVCKECWVETGKYEVSLNGPTLGANTQVLASQVVTRTEAVAIDKGAVRALVGKITSLKVVGTGDIYRHIQISVE